VEAHEVVASLGVQPVHEIGKERDGGQMNDTRWICELAENFAGGDWLERLISQWMTSP
jgi:hypothetical protein